MERQAGGVLWGLEANITAKNPMFFESVQSTLSVYNAFIFGYTPSVTVYMPQYPGFYHSTPHFSKPGYGLIQISETRM